MDTCTVTFSVQRILVTDVDLRTAIIKSHVGAVLKIEMTRNTPYFSIWLGTVFLLFFMLKIIVFWDVHPVVW